MKFFRPVVWSLALVFAAGCAEEGSNPVAPNLDEVAPSFSTHSTTLYTSGSHVQAWGPIYQAYGSGTWDVEACTTDPDITLNDTRWGAAHGTTSFGTSAHPWQSPTRFQANWINAWGNLDSNGDTSWPGLSLSPNGHNWTKYETQVSGNGAFILQLLADNCSWVYLDGTLVGFQPAHWTDSNLTYGVSLNGDHTLTFIIFDGGGLAGGMYRMETTSNPPPPLNPDLDDDGVNNDDDAFPLDPTEWADSDGDGVGDNADAFPNDATETTDSDGDGVGDNADVEPFSITGGNLVIAGCDTGVNNRVTASGATFMDLVADAAAAHEGNHGAFVSAITQMANEWKKDGYISGREKGAITSCVARSDVGKGNKGKGR